MAAVTGLTLVKRFTYRGQNTEEFSNTYHFKSAPPGDDASWNVILSDLLVQERAIYRPSVTFVRAYGYDSDDPNAHHVFQHDYTVPGPPPVGTGTFAANPMAGDQAALVWWKTDRLSSRGKPLYCRKYLHGGSTSVANADNLDSAYQAVLQNYADVMKTFHGGIRARMWSANVIAGAPSPYVTTRTLKRRGKRPTTGT